MHAALCRFQNRLLSAQCQCSTSAPAAAAGPSSCSRPAQAQPVRCSSSSSDQAGAAQPAAAADAPVAQQRVVPARSSTGGRPAQQQQRQQQAPWTYKYRWQSCPSACAGDRRCLEVEALIQHVLSYPAAPTRICRVLPSVSADIGSMTALVEAMASHFGKELTLIYIRKQPRVLELTFPAVLERIKGFRDLFGVLDADVPLMLRKNPQLLLLEGPQLRALYENVARTTRFNPQQLRFFILKFPLVFAMHPDRVRGSVERLRALCNTRDEWARDLQEISPSLLAYFLRDAKDLLMRLEYLAATGERPEWKLREVMKPANRNFRAKLRNYAQWEVRMKARLAEQKAAALGAQAAAAQQAEAAAIKAAILAEGGEEAQEQPAQQQQQQQQQQPGRLFGQQQQQA